MPLSALIRYPTKRELRALTRQRSRRSASESAAGAAGATAAIEGGDNDKDDDDGDDDDEGPEDPADIFTSALGGMFTDDAQNMHGDPGAAVLYRSARFGDMLLRLADPAGEEGRRLFAHYLWNASVLVAELVRRAGWERKGEGEGEELDPEGCNGKAEMVMEERGGSSKEVREQYRYDVDVPTLELGPKAREHDWSVKGETVLELGAGTGLAGITCTLSGAARVCITDYPADELLANIRANVVWNCPSSSFTASSTADPSPRDASENGVEVIGHEWGEFDSVSISKLEQAFSRVIAADCLWLEAEHETLAKSMAYFLQSTEGNPRARVWVVAGFHTGRAKVASFFEEIENQGLLQIEEIWEVDTELRERVWEKQRIEEIGERKKWLLVAILKRRE